MVGMFLNMSLKIGQKGFVAHGLFSLNRRLFCRCEAKSKQTRDCFANARHDFVGLPRLRAETPAYSRQALRSAGTFPWSLAMTPFVLILNPGQALHHLLSRLDVILACDGQLFHDRGPSSVDWWRGREPPAGGTKE